MRHMGGCTECFTLWWGCRCPLRCEECGAGYRNDGNSNCGTPGCRAGQRRRWEMIDRWAAYYEESASETVAPTPAIQCEAIDTVAKPPRRSSTRSRAGVQNGQDATPAPEAQAERHPPSPEPEHRPVAQRRAEVVALLDEGLSNREIARRVKVSPSTVATVRSAQADASRA